MTPKMENVIVLRDKINKNNRILKTIIEKL